VCAGFSDSPAHGNALVGAHVVEYDDVAGSQGWHEELSHPPQEQAAVDGTVEHAWCDDAFGLQARNVMVFLRACGTDAATRCPRKTRNRQ